MLVIIGGTGLYDLAGVDIEEPLADDAFGAPSGGTLKGRLHGNSVLFLARQRPAIGLLPYQVTYRANVFRVHPRWLVGFRPTATWQEPLESCSTSGEAGATIRGGGVAEPGRIDSDASVLGGFRDLSLTCLRRPGGSS
ncbi:MAG: hypothetical protein H0U56_13250 [Methylibium sp.]|nr:hypothetical protein [Methylibium sp.]